MVAKEGARDAVSRGDQGLKTYERPAGSFCTTYHVSPQLASYPDSILMVRNWPMISSAVDPFRAHTPSFRQPKILTPELTCVYDHFDFQVWGWLGEELRSGLILW